MKSVFLIKSPLQLLNAVEAKYCFNLDAKNCVLIIMGDRKSQPQILMLAKKMNEWGSVVVLNEVSLFSGDPLNNFDRNQQYNRGSKSKFLSKSVFNARRLNRVSRCLGRVEYIFVGYVRYIYMRHFVNVTAHEKVILLDDGHATIQIAKDRKQGVLSYNGDSFFKKLKLHAKRYLQGINDKEIDEVCFFTIYDVTAGTRDRIVKNAYKHLKSGIDSLSLSNKVYFIGSPLSEIGALTLESYIEHLSRVKKYFASNELVYIAHRRESPENLKLYETTPGLKVTLFDYPIEYQLAFIGPRPIILASFISSALDSCNLIFADKLNVISFRLDLERSIANEKIEAVYDSYESSISDSFKLVSDY